MKGRKPRLKYRFLNAKANLGQVRDCYSSSALQLTRMIQGNGKYIAFQKDGKTL